jgi:DNA-binding MarR family transcriptional regulator/predicted GNAT family acetyltransferase
LYELAHREQVTASALAADLDLDHGYLSRILRRFGEDGLLKKSAAADDGRQSLITITAKGPQGVRAAQQGLARPGGRAARPPERAEQARVVGAMGTVEQLLGHAPAAIALRPHRPGDMGWVTSANATLYAQEYGWDISYEALVGKITAEFIEKFDPARERCWIAEMNGERVGSVFCVAKTPEIAKLRLLIIDPKARGLGLGKRLVEECLRFARDAAIRRMTLWTQSCLTAARGIYHAPDSSWSPRSRTTRSASI